MHVCTKQRLVCLVRNTLWFEKLPQLSCHLLLPLKWSGGERVGLCLVDKCEHGQKPQLGSDQGCLVLGPGP